MVLSVYVSQDWLQICIQISQVFKSKWNPSKFLRWHGELNSGSFAISCSSLQQWNPENFSPGFFVLSPFEGSVEVQQLLNLRARICVNHIGSVWKEQKATVGNSLLLLEYEKWIKNWDFKERHWKAIETRKNRQSFSCTMKSNDEQSFWLHVYSFSSGLWQFLLYFVPAFGRLRFVFINHY